METIKLDPPLPKLELPDECSYERTWALLERYRKSIIKCLAKEHGVSIEEMEKRVELLTEEYNKQEMENPKYRI
jgi:hypothetical protein